MRAKLIDRIKKLEDQVSDEEPKYIWITVIGRNPAGWEGMSTSIKTDRKPGESDEDLEARVIAADKEAVKKGNIGLGKIRLFHSYGDGWSY